MRQRAVDAGEVDKVHGVSIDAMTAEQLAQAAYEEHGWEIAGHWVSMVTRRADQLRMNDLKNTFANRVANQPIEVAPGFTATEARACERSLERQYELCALSSPRNRKKS